MTLIYNPNEACNEQGGKIKTKKKAEKKEKIEINWRVKFDSNVN